MPVIHSQSSGQSFSISIYRKTQKSSENIVLTILGLPKLIFKKMYFNFIALRKVETEERKLVARYCNLKGLVFMKHELLFKD